LLHRVVEALQNEQQRLVQEPYSTARATVHENRPGIEPLTRHRRLRDQPNVRRQGTAFGFRAQMRKHVWENWHVQGEG
jgi:hypothetical protein